MGKSKYCYVIANKENGKMLLEDGKLPFYWKRSVAKERRKLFKGFVVCKIELTIINNAILSSSIIKP